MKRLITLYCAAFALFLISSVAIAQPVKPTLSIPAHQDTKVPVTPILTWSSSVQPDTFRLQVSTSPVFASTVIDAKTTTSSYMVSAGVFKHYTTYYWRVQGIDMIDSGEWSDTAWFRTIDTTAPIPVLKTPADNAKSIPQFPDFDWDSIPRATRYGIQLSTNPNFTTTLMDTIVSSGQRFVSFTRDTLKKGTTYYWRARAENEAGWGAWSNSFTFEVSFLPPSVPQLLYPADNSIDQTLTLTLDWTDSKNSNRYRVILSTDPTLKTNRIIKDTLANVPSLYNLHTEPRMLAPNTTYYWTIAAGNDDDFFSRNSDTFSFTTINMLPPARPVLLSPKTALVNAPRTPTFTWADTGTAYPADSFNFHISTFRLFTDTVLFVKTTATSYSVSAANPLNYLTVYYWRVAGQNDAGLSYWSYFWNFTTLLSTKEIEKNAFAAKVYPNPAVASSSLEFELKESQPVRIAVIDVTGKEVLTVFEGPLSADKHSFDINVSALKPGNYYIAIAGEHGAQALPLIKL